MTPPRKHSYEHFAQYAAHIGEILRCFPAVVTFTPPVGIKPETYQEYLRRAMQGKRLYQYSHPYIDETLFNQYEKQIRFQATDSTVRCGSLEALNTPVAIAPTRDTYNRIFVTNQSWEEIAAIALLQEKNALNPKPVFVVTALPAIMNIIEQQYPLLAVRPTSNPNEYEIL